MSGRVNRNGLSDFIPADVRRVVRQQCGFGCVVCGFAIVEYEHFDPPFEDAKEHHADGITLLCGACHSKKTRGVWSPGKIAAARKAPVTFQAGCARDVLDIAAPFTLGLGSSVIEDVSTIVQTSEGERWFCIEQAEVSGGPVRLFAEFFDEEGQSSLTIEGNEWKVFTSAWDVEAVGPRIAIRKCPRDIVLEMVAQPPHRLNLTRLKMSKGPRGILVEPNGRVTLKTDRGVTVLDSCSVGSSDAVFLL